MGCGNNAHEDTEAERKGRWETKDKPRHAETDKKCRKLV